MVTIRLLEQVAAEHFVGLNGISRGVEARKNVILKHGSLMFWNPNGLFV